MNRKSRRKQAKVDKKPKYSLNDVQKAIKIAVEMKKISKGHLFSKALKERCVFCGVTQKTKKQCQYWVFTIFDRMQTILVNPDFFRDDEIQALWLQQGEQYQNIKLPLVIDNEKQT